MLVEMIGFSVSEMLMEMIGFSLSEMLVEMIGFSVSEMLVEMIGFGVSEMLVEMIGFSVSEMLVEMMGCCLDAGSGDVLLQLDKAPPLCSDVQNHQIRIQVLLTVSLQVKPEIPFQVSLFQVPFYLTVQESLQVSGEEASLQQNSSQETELIWSL
ncbi:unnamed protein product [Arctogadus glacialis]